MNSQQGANTAKSTLSSSIFSEVVNNNDRLGKYVGEIEEKLHLLVNKRSPNDPTCQGEKPAVQDFATQLSEELIRSRNYINRVGTILTHLSEII